MPYVEASPHSGTTWDLQFRWHALYGVWVVSVDCTRGDVQYKKSVTSTLWRLVEDKVL